MTATDVDGKEETTLLQEENVGKAGRREQGREAGKPDWLIPLVGCISRLGICLGRAHTSREPSPGCWDLPALRASSLSHREPEALALEAQLTLVHGQMSGSCFAPALSTRADLSSQTPWSPLASPGTAP